MNKFCKNILFVISFIGLSNIKSYCKLLPYYLKGIVRPNNFLHLLTPSCPSKPV